MNSPIPKKSQDALEESFLHAVPGERRRPEHNLVHGFRVMSDGKQVAAVYFSENEPFHAVEFALNDVSLAGSTSTKKDVLRCWLQYQKEAFGGKEPNVHKRGAPVDWFRLGFKSVDDALSFLQSFKNEWRIHEPQGRWQIPIHPTEGQATTPSIVVGKSESPEPPMVSKDKVNKWVQAVNRMVITAQDTTAQSNGQLALQTIKNKDNVFASQEEFEQHVLALIERQDGCCAISGLPLQPDEQCDDVEMMASLDRIDSNGHYGPGNLQVVCRFINRWKGADENALFVRLIGALRNT